MSDKIVTLAMFHDPLEAQLVRNRLEAEGIRVLVSGDNTGSLFGGMGGAFGTVHLQVSEEHYPRAMALLESFDEDEEQDEPAQETSSTAITQSEERVKAEKRDTPTDIQTTAAEKPVAANADTRIAAKPERPLAADSDEDDDPMHSSLTWSADDYAWRACVAAVISVMLLPFPLGVFLALVANFYSGYLLTRLSLLTRDLTQRGMLRLYGALLAHALFWGFLCLTCSGVLRIPFWLA
jgi:hypothetical protein